MDATGWIPIAVSVCGALIAIGGALAKREHPADRPRRIADAASGQASGAVASAASAVQRADAAASVAGAARAVTDGMLPRLARVEEDVEKQDSILRVMDRNVARIGVKLRVKVEGSGGDERDSS